MDPLDEDVDRMFLLLSECRFKRDRTRQKASLAIEIAETNQIGCIYLQHRGLVVYPDLLARYLKICIKLYSDDFSSMISRCIENSTEDWAEPSLDLLLDFYKMYPDRVCCMNVNEPDNMEMKNPQLLIGKYHIGSRLYKKCKRIGLSDRYLDAKKKGQLIEYTHPGPYLIERNYGLYGGYRHAYHLLMYGGCRREELITRWQEWGTDCTFEAACDFFNLPEDTSIDIIENRIRQLMTELNI